MDTLLVSIIVPIYKVEEYLDECIESIVHQTYPNIEIILVDDGSPDRCPQLCDEWAKKDNRIKVIHKENGGVSSARNAGMTLAKGDWIWFVDSDDSVEKDALADIINFAADNDLVIFDSKLNEQYIKDENFFSKYYFRYAFGFEPWNKLYKKSIIEDHGLRFDFQEKIGEDLLFNIMYYKFAERYYFTDKHCYNYRMRENSAMNSNYSIRLKQQLSLFSKIFYFYSNDLDESILAQLFIMHLISGINQCDKQNIDDEKIVMIEDSVKKYNFDKQVFKKAISHFLDCENASLLGRIRITLFLLLITHGNVRLALKLM